MPIDKLGSGVKLPKLQKLNQPSNLNVNQITDPTIEVDSIVDSTTQSIEQGKTSQQFKVGSVLLNLDVLESADPEDLK